MSMFILPTTFTELIEWHPKVVSNYAAHLMVKANCFDYDVIEDLTQDLYVWMLEHTTVESFDISKIGDIRDLESAFFHYLNQRMQWAQIAMYHKDNTETRGSEYQIVSTESPISHGGEEVGTVADMVADSKDWVKSLDADIAVSQLKQQCSPLERQIWVN